MRIDWPASIFGDGSTDFSVQPAAPNTPHSGLPTGWSSISSGTSRKLLLIGPVATVPRFAGSSHDVATDAQIMKHPISVARIAFVTALVLAGFPIASGDLCAGPPANVTVELKLVGRTLVGKPLEWSEENIYLLDRSGWLHEFPPSDVTGYKAVSNYFSPYTPSEFRAMLLRALGSGYRVTGTTHYLVAHPSHLGAEWAERFERLYRSFVQFFSVRGFQLRKPEFLMTGIVCRDLKDFHAYSKAAENISATGFEGYYSLISNRIALYMSQSHAMGQDLDPLVHSVIIHEATHQTAYNTGVHNRFCPPPLWVCEGLATMFEAPGVYDSSKYRSRSDRINRLRYDHYKQAVLPNQTPELLKAMVVSDELFNRHPLAAYAFAWAYSFYLMETHPRKYQEYLAITASGKPFSIPTPKQRLDDFVRVFGSDWRFLNAKFVRFMQELK